MRLKRTHCPEVPNCAWQKGSNGTMRDEQVKEKKRLLLKWMVILVLFIVELFIYTQCRVSYRETGFNISEEKVTQKQLMEYRDALKVEYARLLSPERIAKIAETELKLKIPNSEQVIYLER